MNTLRKVIVGIAFLGTWLALLIRFGASRYDNFLFYTDVRPSVGYINSIGLGLAIVYLLGGIVMGAIMVGSIKHEAVKRSLTAFLDALFFSYMLAGATLRLPSSRFSTLWWCTATLPCAISLVYALVPATSSHRTPPLYLGRPRDPP